MGRASLDGMLEMLPKGDAVLRWHLSSNHYPPIMSEETLKAAKRALVNARRGEWSKLVLWKEQSFHPRQSIVKGGKRYVSTHVLVDTMHLDGFLQCT